jgi:hypothetical protein
MTKIRQMAELIAIIFGTIVLRRPVLLAGRMTSPVEPAAPSESDAPSYWTSNILSSAP